MSCEHPDRSPLWEEIRVTESSGMSYAIPATSIVYTSYDGSAWHFGPVALSAIFMVLICGVCCLAGPSLLNLFGRFPMKRRSR